MSFCFGEAAAHLHMTEKEAEALTLDSMADIWKVGSASLHHYSPASDSS